MLRKIPLQVGEEGRTHLGRPEAGPEANQTQQKEAGPEGRSGQQANNPEEGREQEDSPTQRTLAEAGPSRPRMVHALDSPVRRGQEEEARRASPEGHRKSSKNAPREKARVDGKLGRTDQRASIKSGEKGRAPTGGKSVGPHQGRREERAPTGGQISEGPRRKGNR